MRRARSSSIAPPPQNVDEHENEGEQQENSEGEDLEPPEHAEVEEAEQENTENNRTEQDAEPEGNAVVRVGSYDWDVASESDSSDEGSESSVQMYVACHPLCSRYLSQFGATQRTNQLVYHSSVECAELNVSQRRDSKGNALIERPPGILISTENTLDFALK